MSENVKKLMEGFNGGNVTVRSVAAHMAKSGLSVKVHIGRRHGTITLPPKAVGVRTDRMKDDARTAYNNIVNLGNLRLIPKDLDNKLNSIDSRVRTKLNEACVCSNFMPMSSYRKFKETFVACKEEYMAARDEVVSKWETILQEFDANVTTMLNGIRMPKRDRALLHKEIMRNVPSKEDYAASFYMRLDVLALTAMPQLDVEMPDEIKEDVTAAFKEDTVDMAVEMIRTCLCEAFTFSSKAITVFQKTGSISARTLTALDELGDTLRTKNVFSNPMVTKTADSLSGISKMEDAEAEEMLEDCLVSIYAYAKNTGLELDMRKCPFDEEVLDKMAEAA